MNRRALPEDRDGFRFRGGSPVVDLPATLKARLSETPRELLATQDDLARWLVSAGIARAKPAAKAADLLVARKLRESVYQLASRSVGASAEAARKTLNRIAAGTPATPQLDADGSMRLAGPAAALLVTLARDAVALFGSERAELIRQCEAPECSLYFLDTSRRGDRRWCSMAACGNKAKVNEFRRRQAK